MSEQTKTSRRQLLTIGLKALAVAVPVAAVVVGNKPAQAGTGPTEFRRRYRRRWWY